MRCERCIVEPLQHLCVDLAVLWLHKLCTRWQLNSNCMPVMTCCCPHPDNGLVVKAPQSQQLPLSIACISVSDVSVGVSSQLQGHIPVLKLCPQDLHSHSLRVGLCRHSCWQVCLLDTHSNAGMHMISRLTYGLPLLGLLCQACLGPQQMLGRCAHLPLRCTELVRALSWAS